MEDWLAAIGSRKKPMCDVEAGARTTTVCQLTALGLATLLAGTAHANQEQPAASMNETRLEAGRTRDQSTATLVTLTVLTKQEKGDLRPAYQVFTAQIPKIEMASASTRTRASFMLGGHKSALRCISSQPQ